MADGSKLPGIDNKILMIVLTVVIVVVLGLVVFLGNGRDGTQVKVTAKEAAEAKEKGLELYKRGKWDEALVEFKKAVSGNPKDLYAQFQLAYAYEQKGQLDAAYERYQEILKIDNGSADAHYNMGRILVQKKKLDEAITELETAVKLKASFTSARADLANAYVEKKEFQKALAMYDELEKITKTDNFYLSRIHTAKGNIYKQMGQVENARVEFTKALELNNNNKEAAAGLK